MPNIHSISSLSVVILFITLNLSACQSNTIKTEVSDASSSSNILTASEIGLAPNQIFQPILSKIQQQTKIPILLPSYIPESNNPHLIALVEKAHSLEYRVMLAFDEDCTGGTACRLGSISGESVNQNFEEDGEKVTLANNITGYFIDATCGANCSDSTLSWIDNNNRYKVALQAGKLETLMKMANSAILASSLKDTNNIEANSNTKNKAFTISAEGIGLAKLGMTFGELKQKLGKDSKYKILSPFMVDLDAIAVIQSGEIQYYILYPVETNFSNNSSIEILMTENPNYLTREGVGIGTTIKEAETLYGNAILYFNTLNESREYIRFDNQPAQNIYFRPTSSNSDFAGVYSSFDNEYNETDKFHDDATIKSIQIICSSPYCNRQ